MDALDRLVGHHPCHELADRGEIRQGEHRQSARRGPACAHLVAVAGTRFVKAEGAFEHHYASLRVHMRRSSGDRPGCI